MRKPVRQRRVASVGNAMEERMRLQIHISRLRIAFEDSDLPICMDVVDWNQADSEFKAMVARQGMIEMQH